MSVIDAQLNESPFAVQVVPRSFKKSSADTITGVVCITIGDKFMFPDAVWDDIVVEVVSWWMRCIAGMLERSERECVCQFMDGDFQYVVEVQNDGLWLMRFVHGHLEFNPDTAKVLREALYEPHGVVDAVLRAAQVCVDACHALGWTTLDTEQIARDYVRLSQARDLLSPVVA